VLQEIAYLNHHNQQLKAQLMQALNTQKKDNK
jgi:hypothetical protein